MESTTRDKVVTAWLLKLNIEDMVPGSSSVYVIQNNNTAIQPNDIIIYYKNRTILGWGIVTVIKSDENSQDMQQQAVEERSATNFTMSNIQHFFHPMPFSAIQADVTFDQAFATNEQYCILTTDQSTALIETLWERGEPSPDIESLNPDIIYYYQNQQGKQKSDTVTGILETAVSISNSNGISRISSGLLLHALFQYGKEDSTTEHINCAIFMFNKITLHAGDAWNTSVQNYISQLPRLEQSNTGITLSPNVQAILVRASSLSVSMGYSGPYICARHLVAAMLTLLLPQSGLHQILLDAKIDIQELRSDFRDLMFESNPDGEGLKLSKIISQFFQVAQRIVNPANDQTFGEDCLDILPDIRAFANIMTSRALQPPLSIGLFGNWGSGKSFFMQQLKSAVKDQIDSPYSEGDTILFWKNIKQIEFNAWHYIDANLWASLIDRIFSTLLIVKEQNANSPIESAIQDTIKSTKIAKEARNYAECQKMLAGQCLETLRKEQ